MPDSQKYRLQIDRLGNKAMLHTNFGVPVEINQDNNMIFLFISLLQPKLVAVHTAQIEQQFPGEAAKVSLLN